MAERKAVLIRIDPRVHAALERWARDDLRSVNAQMEFVLREGLRRAGRLARDDESTERQIDRTTETTD